VDPLDVPADCGDVCQPALELWLAQVSCHRVGEGVGGLAKEAHQAAELLAAPVKWARETCRDGPAKFFREAHKDLPARQSDMFAESKDNHGKWCFAEQ
jgi:hypothetical protein